MPYTESDPGIYKINIWDLHHITSIGDLCKDIWMQIIYNTQHVINNIQLIINSLKPFGGNWALQWVTYKEKRSKFCDVTAKNFR